MVVLRALSKDPADRYQNAEEMDADLERVARGLSVAPETEEAATTVLRGVDLAASAPTTITRAPTTVMQLRPQPAVPAPVYYDYDEPPRRRAFWPWLLAILLVVAAAIAGVYVYKQIQHELNANAPVGVPLLIGLRELNAVENIRGVGLKIDPAHIHRVPDTTQPIGYVFKQDPTTGSRTAKGNFVSIWVSTGLPKATVPDVRGKSQADAVAALVSAHLKPDVHPTPSPKPVDTVIAQDPKPGAVVPQDSKVRINVSSGPKPVATPNVVGQTYDSAASFLLGQGFAVKRIDVDSTELPGIVISQAPAVNTSIPPGSTITLTVSKGPKNKAIPSVVNLDVDSARTTLTDAGFKVRIVYQDTQDQSLDGVVTLQDPPSNTQAAPGTTVTITVGRFAPGGTTTSTTTPIP
jgi:serine/threonine-protein kinase